MYTTFGAILKELRTSHNLTQEELAIKTSYSKDTIRGIENNRIKPSTTLINKLSYLFNIDLNKYFFAIENDVPVLLHDAFYNFRTAIEMWDVKQVAKLIDEHKNNVYFQKGRGLELIYYAKSICEYSNNKSKSLEYANLALKLNNLTINNLNLDQEIYTITTYNLIGFIGVLYYEMSEFDISEKIIFDLYTSLKHNFFSDLKLLNYNLIETVRLYIILLNNLSTIELHKNNVNCAIYYIDEAIQVCIENYKPILLHNLYFTKFECFYFLNEFEKAVATFEKVLMLSSITSPKYLEIYFKKIESDFPKIKNLIDINYLKIKYPTCT